MGLIIDFMEAGAVSPLSPLLPLLDRLPASFLRFLRENEIDPREYVAADNLPRFIRINPRRPITEEALAVQFPSLLRTAWLSDFFHLDGSVALASTEAYK